MTTLQKFGEVLNASTIRDNDSSANGGPDANIYENGDKIDTNLPVGLHASSGRPGSTPNQGRRIHVRPYNMALLPIIKF